MKKVKIGNLLPYQGKQPFGMGKNAYLDLDIDKLIESRLGVFASSGGGKTYALFKILEATSGLLPQVVLDNEGDFAPLRKRHDFLLAGPGGDFPTQVHLAAILCKKILEENASCIIDLYELKPHEKHRFVRIFLETWLDAPRNLWRPRLLLVDEAHNYAPEKGQGDSEALGAMTEVSAKGRKRKIGFIPATQRMAKISKNLTAELGNKIVGVMYQDQDRVRAAKELEFTSQEQIQSLRRLPPGQFYAYGPALGHDIKLAQILMPDTKPTGSGHGVMKAPAPTAKVKAILDKFKDLPKEAQEEVRTLEDLKKRNIQLTRELAEVKRAPAPKPISELPDKEIKKLREDYHRQAENLTKEFDRRRIAEIKKAMVEMQEGFIKVSNEIYKKHSGPTEALEKKVYPFVPPLNWKPINKIAAQVTNLPSIVKEEAGQVIYGKAEKAILKFLAPRGEREFTKVQVAVGANYAPESPSFRNALSKVRSQGIVGGEGKMIKLLNFDMAANIVGDPSNKEWNENLFDVFMARFGKAEREIMQVLLANQNGSLSKLEIAGKTPTNYSPESPSFRNAMSKVNGLGLTIKEHDGRFKINKEVLDL
jgi:hypothetical protein